MAMQNMKIKRGKTGVNYVTQIVDNNNCNFTPVPQENDVGIDGYIEIFDEKRRPTGEILCVQIKTGKSYYDIAKGVCSFPVEDHRDYWLSLGNKVFGIVCVLDEAERHIVTAYWVDIKKEIKKDANCNNITFTMNKTNEFTEDAFRKFFIPLYNFRLPCITFDEAEQLLKESIIDKDIGLKCLCVNHAQNVKSWEFLIKEYHKDKNAIDLFFFTDSLSYAFSHPDHFYSKGKYEFSNESRSYVIDFVKNMSVEDMICVLELIEDEGIDRGTIGQSIEILFKNIEKEAEKLINIINSDDNDYYVCYYAEEIFAAHYTDDYLKIAKELKTVDLQNTNNMIEYIKENGNIIFY